MEGACEEEDASVSRRGGVGQAGSEAWQGLEGREREAVELRKRTGRQGRGVVQSGSVVVWERSRRVV